MNRVAACLLVSACVHALAAWPLVSHAPGRVVAPYNVFHGATRVNVSLAGSQAQPRLVAIPLQPVPAVAPLPPLEAVAVAEPDPPQPDPAPDQQPSSADQGNTHYYTPEEVQAHARPIDDFDFDFACLPRKKIKFQVWIGEHGDVDQVTLLGGEEQAGLEPGCADSLQHAIAQVRFVPGRRENADVPSIWYLEVWHDAGIPEPGAQAAQAGAPQHL